jgi:hypothetical protein
MRSCERSRIGLITMRNIIIQIFIYQKSTTGIYRILVEYGLQLDKVPPNAT